MADGYEAVEHGLKVGLKEMLDDSGFDEETLNQYGWDELHEMGRRAARLALSQVVCDQRLGPTFDTARVCYLLDVTRQAVAKKVAAGQLVALPSGKTRRFPVWQFVVGHPGTVRAEVGQVVDVFRKRYPEVTPVQIAAWAMTGQAELDEEPPASWLETARPVEPLLLTAGRAAAALAQ